LPVDRESQAFFAVRSLIGDMANLPESPGDVVRGIAVVFYDEEAHGGPL